MIDSDSSTIFVIERNNQTQKINLDKGETISIGTPAEPIDEEAIKKLIENFARMENVLKAYQYLISNKGEPSLVIALKLDVNSENAKKAVIFSVQDAIANKKSSHFIDLLFLEDNESYERVKMVTDSLFYKKPE